MVAAPLVVMLQGRTTDGRHLGGTLILWTFPMSTIGLIMLPKMIAVHHKPTVDADRPSRGATEGVRVTGIELETANP